MNTNGYMTLQEAAQEIGVARTMLYYWASLEGNKRLTIVTVLGRKVVSVADVRRLKAEHQKQRQAISSPGRSEGVA